IKKAPCARFRIPITPKVSVRPLAIRNSSIPYCSPFRICTKKVLSSMPSRSSLAVSDRIFDVGLHGLQHAQLPALRLDRVDVLDRITGLGEPERSARALELDGLNGT